MPPEPIYHRLESTTQTPAVARLQEESGELWGRADRSSFFPSVDAYVGPLPPGERGIEFTTHVEPTPDTPPHSARWTPDCAGVTVEGEFARIPIRVTRNTQRL